MNELSSYYYAKANEINPDTYVGIGYFEPVKICDLSVKEKSNLPEKTTANNTEIYTVGCSHE